jgi:hypothetical protein
MHQDQELATDVAPTIASTIAHSLPAQDIDVLRIRDIEFSHAAALLARYGLVLEPVAEGAAIPGSYWGECEAGLIGSTVFVRDDTPVHSLLHEACHLIVLPPERRRSVHTDATDSVEEEDAVCVLQSLLAEKLPGVGRDRLLADMDRWGYSFRLGSARAYVENDAEDTWRWLHARDLIDSQRRLRWPDSVATG